MSEFARVILYTSMAGIVGTMLGGMLCLLINKPSDRLMGFLFNMSSGVMLGISFLHLLPEAIEFGNIYYSVLGIVIGMLMIILIEHFVIDSDKILKARFIDNGDVHNRKFALMGLMLFLSIALHNLPEGLAVGGGSNLHIGLATTICIGLHNIPEGMAIGLPLKIAKVKNWKIIWYCFLTGVPTLFGGIIGYLVVNISPIFLSLCLSLAAGAMISVVFMEMLPKASEFSLKEHKYDATVSNVFGFVITLFLLLLQ